MHGLLYRGEDAPGSHVLQAIRAATLSTVGFAWACGECALATAVRRHLVKERGLDRRSVMFSGYCKLGQAEM